MNLTFLMNLLLRLYLMNLRCRKTRCFHLYPKNQMFQRNP